VSAVVIKVEDLSTFCGQTLASDSVTFGVAAGEIFGIIGPKGAGTSSSGAPSQPACSAGSSRQPRLSAPITSRYGVWGPGVIGSPACGRG
jgi:hypothetical protein